MITKSVGVGRLDIFFVGAGPCGPTHRRRPDSNTGTGTWFFRIGPARVSPPGPCPRPFLSRLRAERLCVSDQPVRNGSSDRFAYG